MNLILLNISASIMILTTLFIHKIFKKHVPHDIFCILWLVIILRLFFPIKLETRLSLWNLIIKSEHVVADFTNLPISHGYTTIADFVADLRAPTPSAGAELAVYDYSLMQTQLDELALRYTRRMKQQIASARMRLSNDQIRLSHLSPAGQIREKRSYLVSLEEKLERQMQEKLRERRYQVSLYAEKLKGLSPLEKLSQGFSHVADAEGRTVTDVNRIQVGELVTIHVKNGRIVAQVKEKEEWKQPKKS